MFNPVQSLRNAAARFVARSLEAAGGGRRFAGLKPVTNLNNEMAAGGATVAMRASALYHNDSNIRAAVDSLAAHLVGYGFTPHSQTPRRAHAEGVGCVVEVLRSRRRPGGADGP